MNSHEITNQTPFKNIPPFYKQVIQGFIQYNVSHTSQDKNTAVNVWQMCIWGNRHVTNKMGEMLYFPNWIKVVNGRINDKYLFEKLGNKSTTLVKSIKLNKVYTVSLLRM